jgi:uncharacterized protein HemY
MDASALGKWILIAGLAIAGVGALVLLGAKLGLPLGGLPGDIRIERRGFSFYFPVVTCIILSIVLTLIVFAIRFFRSRP